MDNNRVTIVTGGGRGIGKEIAFRMSRETNVFLVGRHRSNLSSVAAFIHNQGGRAGYMVGDVSDPELASEVVRRIQRKGWVVSNLVLNAAIAKGGPARAIRQEDWIEMFDVNVHGAFWFAQACLPIMVEQKRGTICFINSILGVKGRKYDSAYSATKHAQIGMAKSLAHEYAKHGIVVVPICPSFVDTEMTTNMFPSIAKHRGISLEEARDLIAKQNPQDRIIPPEEVAEVVAFVCSEAGISLNGQPLILGGGEQ